MALTNLLNFAIIYNMKVYVQKLHNMLKEEDVKNVREV